MDKEAEMFESLRDAQPSWKRDVSVALDVKKSVDERMSQISIQGDGVTGQGLNWTIRKPKESE